MGMNESRLLRVTINLAHNEALEALAEIKQVKPVDLAADLLEQAIELFTANLLETVRGDVQLAETNEPVTT